MDAGRRVLPRSSGSGRRRVVYRQSPTPGMIFTSVARVCSIDMNSRRLCRTNAQVSTTCSPWGVDDLHHLPPPHEGGGPPARRDGQNLFHRDLLFPGRRAGPRMQAWILLQPVAAVEPRKPDGGDTGRADGVARGGRMSDSGGIAPSSFACRQIHHDVQVRHRRPRRRFAAARDRLRPRSRLLLHRVRQRGGAAADGEPYARHAVVPVAHRQRGEPRRLPAATVSSYRSMETSHRPRTPTSSSSVRGSGSSTTSTRPVSPGCAGSPSAAFRSGRSAPGRTCSRAPTCSVAIGARSTGRTWRVCARSIRRSPSPPSCSRSTGTGTRAPAVSPPST